MSMPSGRLTLVEATGRYWDVIVIVIVIGTDIGEATFGYAMARTGLQVLFCERGASLLDQVGGGGAALTRHFPEEDLPAAITPYMAQTCVCTVPGRP